MTRYRNPRARIPELGELWNPECDDDRSPEQIAADDAANEESRLEAWLDEYA